MTDTFASLLSETDKTIFTMSAQTEIRFDDVFKSFLAINTQKNTPTTLSDGITELLIKQISSDVFAVKSDKLNIKTSKRLTRAQIKDVYISCLINEKSYSSELIHEADFKPLSEQLKSYLLKHSKFVGIHSDISQNMISNESLMNDPKQTNSNNHIKCDSQIHSLSLSVKTVSPFELLNISSLTSIQTKILKSISSYPLYGNFLYTCSCGSGKTLAGIFIIYSLGLRTLIISSRNAVNDQWFSVLSTLYPSLIIEKKDGFYRSSQKIRSNPNLRSDILIYTPQYICKHITDFQPSIGLIIFDEIHALVGDKFIQTILYPFIQTTNYVFNQLPYLIGLTATLPPRKSRGYKTLIKIFGKAFSSLSNIVDIPVYVYDYRLHYKNRLGDYDQFYHPLSEFDCIKYYMSMIENPTSDAIPQIDIHDTSYKGIIMTESIAESFHSAVYLYKRFNISILLIRAVNEPSLFLAKDLWQTTFADVNIDEFPDEMNSINYYRKNKIGITLFKLDYLTYLPKCNIIIGTIDRLKEGFSVQNAVWGICTKFYWSVITRIQILGRIRRMSDDEKLNSKQRIMFVCSGRIPSNYTNPRATRHFIKYDLEQELELFTKENYIQI